MTFLLGLNNWIIDPNPYPSVPTMREGMHQVKKLPNGKEKSNIRHFNSVERARIRNKNIRWDKSFQLRPNVLRTEKVFRNGTNSANGGSAAENNAGRGEFWMNFVMKSEFSTCVFLLSNGDELHDDGQRKLHDGAERKRGGGHRWNNLHSRCQRDRGNRVRFKIFVFLLIESSFFLLY